MRIFDTPSRVVMTIHIAASADTFRVSVSVQTETLCNLPENAACPFIFSVFVHALVPSRRCEFGELREEEKRVIILLSRALCSRWCTRVKIRRVILYTYVFIDHCPKRDNTMQWSRGGQSFV